MTKKYTTKQNMTFREATEQRNAAMVFLHAGSPKMKGRLNEVEDALIQIGDLEWIYKFALEYPTVANIEKIENVLIDCCNRYFPNDIMHIYYDEPPRLEEQSIPSPEWLYYFAMDVPGANRQKIQSVISECYDARTIFEYAKNIPGADIDLLADSIIRIGTAEWIFKFARNIKGLKDYSKLQKAIIDKGSYEYVLKFAKFVKQADIPLMQKQMLTPYDDWFNRPIYEYSNIKCFTQEFDELNMKYIDEYFKKKREIVKLSKIAEQPECDITKFANEIANKNLQDFARFAYCLPIEKLLEIKNLDKINNEIIMAFNLDKIPTKKLTRSQIDALLSEKDIFSSEISTYCLDILKDRQQKKIDAFLKLALSADSDITRIATQLATEDLTDFACFAQRLPKEKLLEIKNLDKINNKIIKNFNLDKIKTTNRDEINYILNNKKFASYDFQDYCFNILMERKIKKATIKNNEQPEQN